MPSAAPARPGIEASYAAAGFGIARASVAPPVAESAD